MIASELTVRTRPSVTARTVSALSASSNSATRCARSKSGSRLFTARMAFTTPASPSVSPSMMIERAPAMLTMSRSAGLDGSPERKTSLVVRRSGTAASSASSISVLSSFASTTIAARPEPGDDHDRPTCEREVEPVPEALDQRGASGAGLRRVGQRKSSWGGHRILDRSGESRHEGPRPKDGSAGVRAWCVGREMTCNRLTRREIQSRPGPQRRVCSYGARHDSSPDSPGPPLGRVGRGHGCVRVPAGAPHHGAGP